MEVTIKTKDKMLEKVYKKVNEVWRDHCEFYVKHEVFCLLIDFLSSFGLGCIIYIIYFIIHEKKLYEN